MWGCQTKNGVRFNYDEYIKAADLDFLGEGFHFLDEGEVGEDFFEGGKVSVAPVRGEGGAWDIDSFIFGVLSDVIWV